MKNTLTVLLIALTWQIKAQDIDDISNLQRNELKLDVAYLLGAAIKVEYEYFLNEWSSIGLAGFFNFGNPNEIMFRTQLLATYRLYFGRQPLTGFFIEGNFGITSGRFNEERIITIGLNPTFDNPYTALGLGVGLGWKFCTQKSGVTLDLLSGFGRMFSENSFDFYPRLGICVGKRF